MAVPSTRPRRALWSALAAIALAGLLSAVLLSTLGPSPEPPPTEPDTTLTVGGSGETGGDDEPVPDPGDPVPNGTYTHHLRLNASQGPLGGEPLPVDRRLFGTNLWYGHGWWPEIDPAWLAMLKAIKPGVLRWPAGHPSQHYCFDAENDGTPFPGCHGPLLSAKELDQFVLVSREVDAEPLFAINVKQGTPEMAAAIVRYANVERGYGITYWHLGNEPDLGGDTSGLPRFTEAWARFSRAMRAVDPTIKLIGPEIMTGANVMGIHGRLDWIRPFLEGNPGDVDGISWHLYPLDSENRRTTSSAYPTLQHLLQWRAHDWQVSGIHFVDVASAKLRQDRADLMPGAEIWVTELGPDSGDPGAPGITDGQGAAVWFADVLGRFAEGDTDAVMQFAFDHWVPGKDELSLIRPGGEGGYQPLPPWYTYYLFAEHWGNRVLLTNASDDPTVSLHASKRDDGKVAVVMVNKGAASTTARLTLTGIGPLAEASAYTLTAPTPTSLDANVNGHTLDAADLMEGRSAIPPVAATASRDALWELPGYSVTFVVFTPK